jgi:hypothetical protein
MPCEAYWTSAAVFVGRVESVKRSGVQRAVTFDIIEAFRGVSSSRVDVIVDTVPAACPLGLKVGGEYLIYAARSPEGSLNVSGCTRSGPAADAAADLAYARDVRLGTSTAGFVGGTVMAGGRGRVPATAVSVSKDGVVETATTDVGGQFRVRARGPGTYLISVAVPERFYAEPSSTHVTLRDARACANRTIVLHDDGHVEGRVVDAGGRPVGGLTLELAPFHRTPGIRFVTDRSGRYRLTRVQAGSYLMSVPTALSGRPRDANRVYFPGVAARASATRVVLDPGERLQLPDFTIPVAFTFVPITGVVLDADGRPAEGARVFIKGVATSDRILAEPVVADFMGQFTIAAVPGADVQVFAERPRGESRSDASGVAVVTVQRGLTPIKLTLARQY